ncbi:hypothetical protein [Neorhodopirellula pilleata]|uniref:Uncharacterized protein n=1 Tax=Neorhodopirellula pilleata TaxID=2714738 RepID=A0A5C6AWF7_9BACT|nr:hypothetical protein [Neorhodopirellula pilleata]TWU03479.1 hypothetical protein Pla100_04060 [Neorhodopirellula pilleata]
MWPLTNGLRCLEGDEANLFRGAVGMMVDQLVIDINARIDDEQDGLDDSATANPLAEELAAWLRDPLHDPENFAIDHSDADDSSDGFGFETPHWYSMWEPEQQIWLLERVTVSLLTAKSAPPASAIFEATVEAIYVELADLIAMEITAGTPIEKGSWRGSLLDAYVQRCPKDSLLSAMQFEATTLDPCLPPAVQKQLKSLTRASQENVSQGSPESLDWLNWWTMVIERLVDATYGPRIYHDAEAYRDGDPRELQRYLRTKGVNAKFCDRIPPLRNHGQTQASIDRLQSIIFQGE